MRHLLRVVGLILLQLALDVAFIYLYPAVSPIRATLIGFSALVILSLPPVRWFFSGYKLIGFLSIYSSAFFGALLVQAGFLQSKSPLSAAVHVLILVVTYAVLALGKRLLTR